MEITINVREADNFKFNEGDSVAKAIQKWRAMADKIDTLKMQALKPFEDVKKELEKEISTMLDVPENEERSETISVHQCASAYKQKKISAKVHDWEIFQRYLVRNELQYAMRKQVNLSAIEEIHEQIMNGELPQPKGVEFTTFNKLYIRRS
jgi:Zn-dependent M32 family carboxypeptidase